MLKLIAWLLVAGGGVLIFMLVLPFAARYSVRRGLVRRSRVALALQVESDSLEISDGKRVRRVALDRIARVRLAQNSNWTESALVEDALTLFDSEDRELEKIPRSASGFDELLLILKQRHIRIENVDVEAPAFFD